MINNRVACLGLGWICGNLVEEEEMNTRRVNIIEPLVEAYLQVAKLTVAQNKFCYTTFNIVFSDAGPKCDPLLMGV